MPNIPASILLAAPVKASTLGNDGLVLPWLGLALPVGLAGVVPLLAGNGAAAPGAGAGAGAGAPCAPLLEEAPEPETLLPGAPEPEEAPFEEPLAGAGLLGTPLACSALSMGVIGFAV